VFISIYNSKTEIDLKLYFFSLIGERERLLRALSWSKNRS